MIMSRGEGMRQLRTRSYSRSPLSRRALLTGTPHFLLDARWQTDPLTGHICLRISSPTHLLSGQSLGLESKPAVRTKLSPTIPLHIAIVFDNGLMFHPSFLQRRVISKKRIADSIGNITSETLRSARARDRQNHHLQNHT